MKKMKKMKKIKKEKPTFYGGQAAMEGVMMLGKKSYALSVRSPDGQVKTVLRKRKIGERKGFFLKLPVVRGIVSFASSLYLQARVIYDSADMSGMSDLTDENPSRFEKWLTDKAGDKLFDYVMYISVVLSLAFSVGLFMLLPAWVSSLINPLIGERKWILAVCEGLLRVLIFIGYLFVMSRVKEVRRLFQYHGAEHKAINCHESGAELTTGNIRTRSRLNKRCGTSFLLIVMMVSMAVFFFVRVENIWLRLLSRVLLAPVIAGLSYELIMWAGRSDSRLVRWISAPGLWLQKLTTAEPDDRQMEVAAAALKAVLVDDGVIPAGPAAEPAPEDDAESENDNGNNDR